MRKLWKAYFLLKARITKLLFPLWSVPVNIYRQSFPYAFLMKLRFLEAWSILLWISQSHLSRVQLPSCCSCWKSWHLDHNFSPQHNFWSHPRRLLKATGTVHPKLQPLTLSWHPTLNPAPWTYTFPNTEFVMPQTVQRSPLLLQEFFLLFL